MPPMSSLEIRFHGRGGQGTVLAAKILAEIVLRSGRGQCLAIPEFGVERRGAPVVAYARISDKKIFVRSRIYEPQAVVLLDSTLAAAPEITRGLRPGGIFIINSDQSQALLAERWLDFRVIAVPARRIAVTHNLGPAASPVVNTAMCGALAAVFGLADEICLEQAIRLAVPTQAQANVAAAREAYHFCLEQYARA